MRTRHLEAYLLLGVPKERLEALYGREVVVADREFVEQGIDGMLNEALEMDVAFLVRAHPRASRVPRVRVPRRGARRTRVGSLVHRRRPPPIFSVPSVPTRELPADSQPPPRRAQQVVGDARRDDLPDLVLRAGVSDAR